MLVQAVCDSLHRLVTECYTESRLTTTPGVNSVMVGNSQILHDDLFNFDDTGVYYCAPSNQGNPTITITFPTSVLLTEIGIHGYDGILISNHYVTRFSLSYENDGNFTEYNRQTGLVVWKWLLFFNTCQFSLCRLLMSQITISISLDYGLLSILPVLNLPLMAGMVNLV